MTHLEVALANLYILNPKQQGPWYEIPMVLWERSRATRTAGQNMHTTFWIASLTAG